MEESRQALVSRKPGLKSLASPFAACVTLGKLSPQPQSSCLYNGNDGRTNLNVLL